MNSKEYILGMLCGMLVVGVLAFVVGYAARRLSRGKTPGKYDERQQAAQGKVFKSAYYTLLGYLALYGIFDIMTGIVWCDRFTGVMLGILLSTTVFAIGCIMKDAYFRMDEKPVTWTVLIAAVGILNIGVGIGRILDGSLLSDGMLSHSCINLAVGIMFIVILAAVFVKRYKDRETE